MVEMLARTLLGSLLLLMVLLGWVGVQALFRKSEKLPPDCDVLQAKACAQCDKRVSCSDPVRFP